MRGMRRGRISWRDEAGFFLSGIVVRFVVLLALFGLVVYDTTQVVLAQVRAQSVSRAAALAGADTYYRSKRADLAQRDAVIAAREVAPAAKIIVFRVEGDGSITVGAEKSANTLLVRRMGITRKFNRQKAEDTERRNQ